MPFDPEKATQIVDQIALLRLAVGYLGQCKQSGGWDCDFLDATGIRFLEATFPRTAWAAALRSTTEAASIVHDQALGRVGNFHLYRLPPALEDQLEHALEKVDWLAACKQVESRAIAMDVLKRIADAVVNAPIGPVQVGAAHRILTPTSIHELAAHYHSAFQEGITASPLWKLFRLPKWQRDLKACWEKLEKGEYDWAHLAYSIWPKRVEEVCKKDRSIAIAHNLEHLCQLTPSKPKAKRGRKVMPDQLDNIVAVEMTIEAN